MRIESKYSIDNPPGTWDRRVFIGGNYDFGSRLEDICDAVRDCEYIPIIAWDFGIPPDTERHSSGEIIKQCKYAIFEVSSDAGYFFEMEDAQANAIISLCLWDAYQGRTPMVSRMVKSHSIFKKNNRPYRNTRTLQNEVYKFLQHLS